MEARPEFQCKQRRPPEKGGRHIPTQYSIVGATHSLRIRSAQTVVAARVVRPGVHPRQTTGGRAAARAVQSTPIPACPPRGGAGLALSGCAECVAPYLRPWG